SYPLSKPAHLSCRSQCRTRSMERSWRRCSLLHSSSRSALSLWARRAVRFATGSIVAGTLCTVARVDWLADSISGVSIAIAGWVGLSQRRATRRQDAFQQRLAAIEEGRRLDETAPAFEAKYKHEGSRA